MDKQKTMFRCSWAMAAVLVMGLANAAQAVDGVFLINQTSALAGYVTPGDVPGFPVTISLPGSYRLEGNLTVPTVFITAIQITADNVTLDLNGFAILVASPLCLTGPGVPCPANGHGVEATDRENVAVLNGTVSGMGGSGVTLGKNGRVDKVRVLHNRTGINTGQGSVVTGNTAQGNSSTGIYAGANSIVEGNVAMSNLRHGIYASYGSTVQGNTANLNGVDGINAELYSSVIGNTAARNARFGLGLSTNSSPNDAVGYVHNVLSSNGQANVSGGTTLGQNLCNSSTC